MVKKEDSIKTLRVEITAKKGLKGVPGDKIQEIIETILDEQPIKKKFKLNVQDETHRGSISKAIRVNVGNIDKMTPGIGIIIKICLADSDIIWNCKLMFPVYVDPSDYIDFHQQFKEIASIFYGEPAGDDSRDANPDSKSADENEKKMGASTEDEGGKVFSQDSNLSGKGKGEAEGTEEETISTQDNVLACGEKLEAPPENPDPTCNGIIPPVESQERLRQKSVSIFFKPEKINEFICFFIERAGGKNMPLNKPQLDEVFKKTGLPEMSYSRAMPYLLKTGLISRPGKKKSLYWLSEKAREMHEFKSLRQGGENPLAVIAKLSSKVEELEQQLRSSLQQLSDYDEGFKDVPYSPAEAVSLLKQVKHNILFRLMANGEKKNLSLMRMKTGTEIRLGELEAVLKQCDERDGEIFLKLIGSE